MLTVAYVQDTPPHEHTVTNRKEVLSALQSGLDHRMKLLPSDVHVCFATEPTSIDDPPAPITPSTHASMTFIEVYEWLKTTRIYLATLSDVQDHDVDSQLAALLCKVDEHVRRLTELQLRCWEQEKVAAGLYGLRIGGAESGLVIFDPGKWLGSRSLKLPT